MRVDAAATLALLVVASSARAEFIPRAIVSYGSFTANGKTSAGFRQTYDLRLEKTITEPAKMRVFVRVDDFRGDSNNFQVQPGGELFLTFPTIALRGSYGTTRDRTEVSGTSGTRERENAALNLRWQPEGLPALTVQAQRFRSSDNRSRLSADDDSVIAGVDYQWKRLAVSARETYLRSSDSRFGFGRRSLGHQAQASIDHAWLDGRVTGGTSAYWNQLSIDERATSGSANVPTPVLIARASVSIDDTPLDSRAQPPALRPALIDGDLTTSAGINLGPDGSSFQNIALDFGRVSDVDEIRVVVRDENGDLVRRPTGVQWDVYTSRDGILWVAEPGANSTFDLQLSLYSITFDRVRTQYVKVVNFGVNAEPMLVTETQAFFHTSLSGRTRHTTNQLLGALATLSAQPLRWITVSYAGAMNSTEQRPGDRPEFSGEDMNHTATAQFDPWRYASFAVRFNERTLEQNDAASHDATTWTGTVTFTPLPRLNVAAEADTLTEDFGERRITSDTIAMRVFARLLPALDISLNNGVREHRIDDQSATSRFFTASMRAQLSRTVRLQITGSQEDIDEDLGQPLPGIPRGRESRWYADSHWRAGPPLALGVRIGWLESGGRSALTQRYRVEWHPLAGGAVSVAATYDQDIDAFLDRRVERVLISPRWTINRHALLDVGFIAVRITGTAPSETESFNVSLTLTR